MNALAFFEYLGNSSVFVPVVRLQEFPFVLFPPLSHSSCSKSTLCGKVTLRLVALHYVSLRESGNSRVGEVKASLRGR